MSFELYIQTLQKIFNEIELAGLLDKLDNDTLRFVEKYLKENITLKNDKIEMNAETVKALKRFNSVMDKFFSENKNLTEYLLKSSQLIIQAGVKAEEFYKGQVSGFNDSRIKATQELITNNYLDSLKGLNEEFKNPIRKIIVDNLTRDRSFTEIKDDMQRMVKGSEGKSGLMKKYLTANARIAANAYNGNTSQYFWSRYKDRVTHVGVSGTIIKTSAPQCVISVKDYNKRVPVDKFKSKILPLAEDNGLIEGTTIDNVWTNTLHWNCRHAFTPLILKN